MVEAQRQQTGSPGAQAAVQQAWQASQTATQRAWSPQGPQALQAKVPSQAAPEAWLTGSQVLSSNEVSPDAADDG